MTAAQFMQHEESSQPIQKVEMQKPNVEETVYRPDILVNEKPEVVQLSKEPDGITRAWNCTLQEHEIVKNCKVL